MITLRDILESLGRYSWNFVVVY